MWNPAQQKQPTSWRGMDIRSCDSGGWNLWTYCISFVADQRLHQNMPTIVATNPSAFLALLCDKLPSSWYVLFILPFCTGHFGGCLPNNFRNAIRIAI
jgi:hypothetical protein